mmetsp:Transcript_11024/g.12607  ORF Transcript_11024/g.12607 Transcript_11024/m.12607 type:complete len:81 (+) Transcript_11024:315-557(+)
MDTANLATEHTDEQRRNEDDLKQSPSYRLENSPKGRDVQPSIDRTSPSTGYTVRMNETTFSRQDPPSVPDISGCVKPRNR